MRHRQVSQSRARRSVTAALAAALVAIVTGTGTVSPASASGPEPGKDSGGTIADFDSDGFDDLVIGVPGEDVSGESNAGMVNVIYGSDNGLTVTGDQTWHQNSSGIKGGAEAGDRFGDSIAVGDFNGDLIDDLAVGVPGEDVGSVSNAGMVNVIYGSSSGLTATGDQTWHQNSSGIKGGAEAGDRFGASLAAGDFDGDFTAPFDDLAVGVPDEDVGSVSNAGMVNVIEGSSNGLRAGGDQTWHQNTPGIDGDASPGDRFGAAVAAADFGYRSQDDLAVGVPGEDIGTISNAGAVNAIYGTSSGLTTANNRAWRQGLTASPGVSISGSPEPNDQFGAALAAADFGITEVVLGGDDLAIGVPGEDIGSITNAGAVNVIYGSSNGLAFERNRMWHQDSDRIEGGAEPNDRFGTALAAADLGWSSPEADLAVGVPFEDILTPSATNAGAVNVIYGSAGGLTAANDQMWHAGSDGIAGAVEPGDAFGSSVAAADFGRGDDADLVIGVPNEDVGSTSNAGMVNVIYGTPTGLASPGNRFWHQNSALIGGAVEAGDQFGLSVAAPR